ncbi:translation initiation factor IF-2 [Candidatus Saccharibacteria bacterium]|nr:translation initiation factor IF-2 [Candidatus Saccharibacteria bacterium]HPG37530.1 translation initiation factor IF-2 [Candidatus Saccharibacteria bacterium]
MANKIQIDDMVTVGALADLLLIPVTKLIGELFKNGIMATVNERIDFDTAQIMVQELGLDVELERKASADDSGAARVRAATSDKAEPRPPVVAVMGHVDHGKTSLLDAIRTANVAKGEAGGITQHISAYQIDHGGRKITFLDTPGHEAFAAIRQHGAQLTDIVILVVAADDGIKPQTIEAIRYARQAGVKIIVAANKMDKEGADINRLKQQLSEHDLLTEEWGGDTIVLPVSAKTKAGIPELLDMVLLVTDVEELKADTDVPARGLIIEAHVETGRGPVAHALVEAGMLRPGQFVVAGSAYAKVRNLESTSGGALKEAGPSTPVVMTGFKTLPEFGDEFSVVANEKAARAATQAAAQAQASGMNRGASSTELLRIINRSNELSELNIIVKADVQGSLTSVIDSLKALDTAEVAVRVVSSGVGAITDNDIRLASASGAVVYGFNVGAPSNIRQEASRDRVSVRLYKVIYELIDDVHGELEHLLSPEIVETPLGRLVIRGIFNTTKTAVICGGEVTKGRLQAPSLARVFRGNDELMEVEVVGLKRGPSEAKDLVEGEMGGVSLKTPSRLDLMDGDRLEVFTREAVKRSL